MNEIKHHSAIGLAGARAKTRGAGPWRRVMEFDAHHRVAVAVAIAALTFGILPRQLSWPVPIVASWDAFALTSLALAWIGMILADVKTRMREAHLQDSGRGVICGCVVFAAVAALFGAGLLLGTTKGLTVAEAGRHVGLAALTVISSWLLVCRAHRAPWSRSAFTDCRSGSARSP